jgi:hypothetical protein
MKKSRVIDLYNMLPKDGDKFKFNGLEIFCDNKFNKQARSLVSVLAGMQRTAPYIMKVLQDKNVPFEIIDGGEDPWLTVYSDMDGFIDVNSNYMETFNKFIKPEHIELTLQEEMTMSIASSTISLLHASTGLYEEAESLDYTGYEKATGFFIALEGVKSYMACTRDFDGQRKRDQRARDDLLLMGLEDWRLLIPPQMRENISLNHDSRAPASLINIIRRSLLIGDPKHTLTNDMFQIGKIMKRLNLKEAKYELRES